MPRSRVTDNLWCLGVESRVICASGSSHRLFMLQNRVTDYLCLGIESQIICSSESSHIFVPRNRVTDYLLLGIESQIICASESSHRLFVSLLTRLLAELGWQSPRLRRKTYIIVRQNLKGTGPG